MWAEWRSAHCQHKYSCQYALCSTPEEAPFRPDTLERRRRKTHAAGLLNDHATPFVRFLVSTVAADFSRKPIKIVQQREQTVVLYEAGNAHRQIYTRRPQLRH